MVFKFTFTGDAASPNVLSPEIFNLLIFFLCLVFFIWLLRLCKGFISMTQLTYALRSGRFNILNIANFHQIDNLWGEGSVRSFIQALFRGNVSSPSLPMKRINTTVHLHKNSIRADSRNITLAQKGYGITFKFDTLVTSSVQLFWGVKEQAFNKKVLLPFKNLYNESLELNEKGEVISKTNILSNADSSADQSTLVDLRDTGDDEYPDDANTSLLGSVNQSSFHHDSSVPVYLAKRTIKMDLNQVLDRNDYISKSQARQYPPSIGNMFVMPLEDLIPADSAEQLFTSLPLHRRTEESEPQQTSDENDQNENENNDQEVANDDDEASIVVDDDETSNITLPLIIALKALSKHSANNTIKRDNEYACYDEESVGVYCFAYFHKSTPSSESATDAVQYTAKVYKTLLQTENGLYEVQDMYGTSEDAGEDRDEKCIICWDEDREIALLPCRHMCVCQQCFQQIDKCPICRQNTISYIIMGEEQQIQPNNDQDPDSEQQRVDRLL